MSFYLNIFFSAILLLTQCGPPSTPNKKIASKVSSKPLTDAKPKVSISSDIPYDLQRPTDTYVLNSKLQEISGLAYDNSSHTFLANNDEMGICYRLNADDFNVVEKYQFAKKGDYEGIENIDDNIIVAKHNGTLYVYNIPTKETTILKNKLKSENDIEGLCYLPSQNYLLLAAKGIPINTKDKKNKEKCIYAFDLETQELISEPYICISDDTLIEAVENLYADEPKSKRKKAIGKIKSYAPSGIAIHPVSGDYYTTSARGSIVVIFDKNKSFRQLAFLNNKTIPQPEGITFDAQNNLYISSEGQGLSGKVFKFPPK